MADSPRRARKWVKLGCFSVLGLAGVLVLWIGSLFGLAYWRAHSEVVESRELSRAIPRAVGAGRVVLDLAVGDFNVVPGDPGDPVIVDAEFDRRSYELREEFEESGTESWTYRVTFEETLWFKDGGLRGLIGGGFPRITIRLPPDVPLALEGKFGKGVAQLRLGGLWLTEVDLEFRKGAMIIDVDHPLVAPLERMTIRSRQGHLLTRKLGNASPRVLEIDHWIGGLAVDLRGDWVRDAEILVGSHFSVAEMRLPRGVEIEGLPTARGHPGSRRESDLPLPTLRMTVSSRLGGLRIFE